jgi:hypothetical protein
MTSYTYNLDKFAFLLLRNKTYEHSLISVIHDTRTLVMDVWQELEWIDPGFTWNDEPHGTINIETTGVALENGRSLQIRLLEASVN